MRVLLLQRSVYAPAYGGANRSNQVVCELLADRGHVCEVLALLQESTGKASLEDAIDGLCRIGAAIRDVQGDGVSFELNRVTVRGAANPAKLRDHAQRRLKSGDFDVVLVSSEDPFQEILCLAAKLCPGKVVFFAHTTLLLPFGPGCVFPMPRSTEVLRQVAGTMCTSQFMRDYLKRWAGLDSSVVRLPIYGPGPFPDFGKFDSGEIVMINPCAVKGLPLFLAMADAFPHLPFAAKVSWGTTAADVAALKQRTNITLLGPVANMDEIYGRCRALIVPSLWSEAFGAVSVEAMLRGIPVLGSDSGGLPEAKLGIEYVLPVNQITTYTGQFDDRLMPEANIPEQDPAPWFQALEDLFSCLARYCDISTRSRQAAHEYVETCNIASVEQYLEDAIS